MKIIVDYSVRQQDRGSLKLVDFPRTDLESRARVAPERHGEQGCKHPNAKSAKSTAVERVPEPKTGRWESRVAMSIEHCDRRE
jgi:hypothetical protein